MNEISDIEVAKKCARLAFAEILATEDKKSLKANPGSPQTAADLAAEEKMRAILKKNRPEDNILGEEFGGQIKGRTWIIDPIDGTINFMRDIPGWSTAISLVDGQEDLVSVVIDSQRGLWVAEKGERPLSPRGSLPEKPLLANNLKQAVLATYVDQRRFSLPAFPKSNEKLLKSVATSRALGGGTFEILLTAAGQVDIFAQYDMKLWDRIPGEIFIKQSGGYSEEKDGWFIASRSKDLFQELKTVLF